MNQQQPGADGHLTRRGVVIAGALTAATAFSMSPAGAAPRPADSGADPASAAQASTATGSLQPYASYWYPDSLPAGAPGAGITWRSLKNWTAEDDPDLAFNTSTVPLAPRFTPVPANTSARSGQARISSLVSFGPTSGNPSQGSATADYYALTHWSYLDELVFWGGSSGEGLILAPNAPIVDAAHRHGVPVLGNIYLPPGAFGGQLQWTRDLAQRDTFGGYPIADQLAAVAVAHGFDGWFVNAETEGGNAALGTDMQGFLRRLRTVSDAAGLRITWYDAMTAAGQVSWQGALDSANQTFYQDSSGKVSDSFFVDFRWSAGSLASSGTLAGSLDRSRYDLWAGVDVESSGWNTGVTWDSIVPTTKPHVVSIGFYRPEWTRNQLPATRTPAQFHAADDRFWTGQSLDPSKPDLAGTWRAPAVSVADRSTVTALPFASTFNTGHGLRWYENGAVTSDAEWNNLGLQDRLPGRRWVVRTTGTRPAVSFDFDNAWRGGSSLLVDGVSAVPVSVDLYSTRLPLTADTVVEITHRADTGPVTVELAVATADPSSAGGTPPYTYLAAGAPRTGSGWVTSTVRVGALLPGRGARTIRALGVRLTPKKGSPAAQWRLGAIAVRAATGAPAAPTALAVTATALNGDATDFRLAWQGAPGSVRHYELHRVLADGSRRFLGGTPATAFHAAGQKPEQGEAGITFEVCAVSELYTVSTPVRTVHTW